MDFRKLLPWGIRRYLKRIADVPDMWNTLYRLKEQDITPKTIFLYKSERICNMPYSLKFKMCFAIFIFIN